MTKIEPPPPEVLKDLAKYVPSQGKMKEILIVPRTSHRMLAAVADGDYLEFDHSWFEEHDMIIFDATGGSGGIDERRSCGTITGTAWYRSLDQWMFIITPAWEGEGASSDDDLDYPLILVFDRNVHLPKYVKGELISERDGVAKSTIKTFIDERKVVLDAEGRPAYHYRLRHEVKESQFDVTEEKVKDIQNGS